MTALFPEITVNGTVIDAAAIAAEAQNHPAPRSKPGFAWQAAARALVIRHLLLEAAAGLGLQAEPQPLGAGRAETDDDALIRALLEVRLAPEEVTPAQCQRYYDANPGKCCSPELFQASHILFAARPDDAGARATAKARAGAALAILQRDPGRFSQIAREQSDCSSRDNGGSLGQIGAGSTVAEFERALAAMAAGSLSPAPVETRYGFHIIRLEQKAGRAQLPFSAAEAEIRDRLEARAWTVAARAYTEKLVAGAKISGIAWPAGGAGPGPDGARDPALSGVGSGVGSGA